MYYVNMHTVAGCSTQSLLAEPQHFLAEPTEKKGFHGVCTVCVYTVCVCMCVCCLRKINRLMDPPTDTTPTSF